MPRSIAAHSANGKDKHVPAARLPGRADATSVGSVGGPQPDDDDAELSLRAEPAPLSSTALRGVLGQLVRTLEPHTEADPAGVAMQMLTAFGSAVGRAPYFEAGRDRHHLNLFLLLVGFTSAGRKGASWGEVRSVLAHADPDWVASNITSGMSSGEGVIWAVRDPIDREEPIKEKGRVVGYETVRVDAGVSDKRCLWVETEFGKVLKVMARENNILSGVLRQAWDDGTIRAQSKGSPARATDAHISIVAHITPDELRRLLDKVDVANGFLNRYLIGRVKRSKCLPDGGDLDSRALAPITAQVREALDFGRRTGRMRRDDGARELWHEEYQRLTEPPPGQIGAVTSRAAPQVMRLACIFALLDLSAMVRVEHLAAALEVHRYVEESVAWVFGESLGDPVANAILGALRERPQGMTRTDIRDLFAKSKSKTDIDRALVLLAEHNRATRTKAPALARDENAGGRPREVWTLTTPTKPTKPTKAPGGEWETSVMSDISAAD